MVKILNSDGREVIPAVHVILIEETLNWCEAIQQRAGRLFGVYLFDKRRHVHACEFTPSYELHFLKTIFTAEFPDTRMGEIQRDRLEQEIMLADAQTDPVSYMHVHTADAMPTINLSRWSGKHYREISADYDDAEELHEAVMTAMIQAESECESDYDSLMGQMDRARVPSTAP